MITDLEINTSGYSLSTDIPHHRLTSPTLAFRNSIYITLPPYYFAYPAPRLDLKITNVDRSATASQALREER
jgi:hypothetical protein